MGINEESGSPESNEAALAFICKRLYLNYAKLTDEKKKGLARFAEKSDLLTNPNPQRERKKK